MKAKKLIRYLILGIAATYLASLLFPREKGDRANTPRDYAEIAAEGVLRATTEYNSIGFYADGDTISGFHYELIKAFGRDHDLEVVIVPKMSFEERKEELKSGKFDLIATGILATSALKDSLLLTTPITLSRQVLVQRKASGENDSAFIDNQLKLGQKTLHVVKGSPSILRIQHLSNEIADTIYIKEVEKYGPEQLIALVAHGDIDYTVCDENIAKAAIDSLPQIDINTAIGFTQFYSWGVGKHSPILLDSLNQWLSHFLQTNEYKAIYKKYYKRTN